LWERLCAAEALCLFCAYPHASLADHRDASAEICAHHSRVIPQ
jgi:hypothetical protein